MRDQQDTTSNVLAAGYTDGEFDHSYSISRRYNFDAYNRPYEPYRARFFKVAIDVFVDNDSLNPIKTYDTDMVAMRRFFTGKVLSFHNILSLIEQELGGFSATLPRLSSKQQSLQTVIY